MQVGDRALAARGGGVAEDHDAGLGIAFELHRRRHIGIVAVLHGVFTLGRPTLDVEKQTLARHDLGHAKRGDLARLLLGFERFGARHGVMLKIERDLVETRERLQPRQRAHRRLVDDHGALDAFVAAPLGQRETLRQLFAGGEALGGAEGDDHRNGCGDTRSAKAPRNQKTGARRQWPWGAWGEWRGEIAPTSPAL